MGKELQEAKKAIRNTQHKLAEQSAVRAALLLTPNYHPRMSTSPSVVQHYALSVISWASSEINEALVWKAFPP